jgi:PAS domain S-box-containing protein
MTRCWPARRGDFSVSCSGSNGATGIEDAWFDLSYSPLHGDEGAIAGVLVTVVETTGQVVAERMLAGEVARQRRLFEQAPGFIAILSGPEHVFEFANKSYARLIGKGDVLGKTVREALPDIAGQGFYELLDEVYRTGKRFAGKQTAISLKRGPGDAVDVLYIDFVYEPVVDEAGAVTGVFVQGHDVTAAHTAQQALRDLNADLERQVVERANERGRTWQISPELMGVLNRDARFELSNPAWLSMLGWSEEDVSQTSIFDLIHPDDFERSRTWFDMLKQGEPILRFENRFRRKDGGYCSLSWLAVPEDAKFYCSARDITFEVGQTEDLRRAEEGLRQAQKMEAVGQLTGGVAHDFNNLLTIISSSIDFLQRPDLPQDRRDRYLKAIADTVERAAKLTSQLLAFARRQPLTPKTFDIGKQVRSVVDLMRPLVGSRVEVVLDLPHDPCFAYADVGQFETALVNLAVNARDAMNGEGKIRISVKATDAVPAVRAHLRRSGDFLAISITDTGSGIAPGKLEAIFEPFYTTKEVGKGTGLGLSQVFGFTKQSAGEVKVESVVGQGTTFTLYLPRSHDLALVDPASPVPPIRVGGKGYRVLVVEDNEAVGRFSTEMLHDLGYETVWVANASDALRILAEGDRQFELVFSDVVMPGMNGLEMARVVRDRHPGVPVVLTSGYSGALTEGFEDFKLVKKPYSVEVLSRVLQTALIGKL